MRRTAVSLLVWTAWVGLFAGALLLVGRFGSNVPSWDEWDMVPALTGNQPVTAGWLWSQHNEHRVPLPRLVLLALDAPGGPDFRIAQVLNAVLLALGSAVLVLAARRARGGRTVLADAIFPLLLLHPRHAANLLWGWQLQFVASSTLACVVLAATAGSSPRLSRSALTVVGVGLLLLPLCGANGVALVPAMALWLGHVGLVSLRRGELARGLAAGGAALASVALVGAYFLGFESVPNYWPSPSWSATAGEAVRFLAAGFGPNFRALWPLTGVVAVLGLLSTLAVLAGTILRRPDERLRALGLLAFLGAMGSLALGLGLGGRYGFEPRYVTLAAPAWCGAYLAWTLCAPQRMHLRVLGSGALALAALASFQPNLGSGLRYARDLRAHLSAFEHDARAGLPPYRLIARHRAYLHPHHELLSDYMPMLRAAGVGAFAELAADPGFAEVPIALAPLSAQQCSVEEGTLRATGSLPYVVLALPPGIERVAGLRLVCEHSSELPRLPCIALYWHAGDAGAPFGERYYMFSPTGDRGTWERNSWSRRSDPEITLTCWLDEPATYLRLHPDYKPCELRVRELVALVERGR